MHSNILTDFEKAALLDPRAYTTYHARLIAPFDETVPPGETWLALNLWGIADGDSLSPEYYRHPQIDRPLILPDGTRFRSYLPTSGYAYICKPSSVAWDIRYRNPDVLLQQRLHRLRRLPQHRICLDIPAHSPMLQSASSLFPTDFEHGILISASHHNVSWVGLQIQTELGVGCMPADDEINDTHAMRFTGLNLIPFSRSIYTGARANPGSDSGLNNEQDLPISWAGSGVLRYCKLPSDW